MNKNSVKKMRTESILSIVITSAIVLTLALTVVTALNKNNSSINDNIVDLNETKEATESVLENTTVPTVDNKPTTVMNNVTDAPTVQQIIKEELETVITPDEPETISNANTSDTLAVNVMDSVTSNLSFSENSTLYWPLSGEILLNYNMDNTIWFPTLEVYKCNPALYIASDVGTKVSSSCKGVVEEIYEDVEMGNVVKVSVGNNYHVLYGSLKDIKVIEGDLVNAGDTIGYVNTPTIYYNKEGSGIFFEVMQDETPVDPMNFLGQ